MKTKAEKLVYCLRSALYITTVIFSILVIMGIDQCVFEGCDCEDAIQTLLDEKGEPLDFEIVESGTTNSHTYRYEDSFGITREYTFEWGEEDSEGNILKVCCKESITTVEEEEPEDTEDPTDPEDSTDDDDDDETDTEDETDSV